MKHLIRSSFVVLLIFGITSSSIAQQASRDLMISIKENNTALLDQLINDQELNECFEIKGSSYNVLAMSIKMGAIASMKYFIDRNADLERNCTGKTALMYAVKYGQMEMVQYLVEQGANVHARHDGKNALDYAIKYQQSEIEKYLKAL